MNSAAADLAPTALQGIAAVSILGPSSSKQLAGREKVEANGARSHWCPSSTFEIRTSVLAPVPGL
jgi:hypothetical protein